MVAAKEQFSLIEPTQAEALPWIADAALLDKDKVADWVKALRATGVEQFSQTGLPNQTWEGWQHTNLRPLTQHKFKFATHGISFDTKKIPTRLLKESDQIIVVNGQYQPQLSQLPKNLTVLSLMDAVAQKFPEVEEYLVTVGDLKASPMKALNTAYFRDGLVIKVDKGIVIDKPVEVVFYNTGSSDAPPAIYPRMLYVLGENSHLTLIERHVGTGVYFANSYTGIVQKPASRLNYYKFEDESHQAFHFSCVVNTQEKDSHFEGFSAAIGGKTVRQEFHQLLIDRGICSKMNGIYLMNGQQNHDFTVLMDHFEPNGTSVQHFKGVVDAQARTVFQGKIHVRRSAQKSDGRQLSHALLLSDQAEASSQPALEIYADDVKCAHGSTSGQLDAKALFYLRSRGIPLAEAKALLIQSFLNTAVDEISFQPIKEIYQDRIIQWLGN